jgi:membrane-associated phospholipid phosphatase
MRQNASRIVGAIGTIVYVAIFIRTPSFPTPDKILVFASFVAMAFGQTRELLKRFVPFVALLLIYESFRGLVPHLNAHVNYGFMPWADKLLFFGHLPTKLLQNILWHGSVQWYDFVFYGAYTLHFVLPFALAVLIWKTREKYYWRFITTFVIVSFAGFLTFLAFPAAPPWLASDKGLIEPIAHVSSAIWAAFGIHDFPSVYNKISPNPVAAVPSLHAAYSMLFALFLTRLFKTKWRLLAWTYPALIWIGTTYMGEHYVIDIIIGVLYAVLGYFAAPYVLTPIQEACKKLLRYYKSVVK